MASTTLLLLLLLLPMAALSQTPPDTTPPPSSNAATTFNSPMAVLIAILITAFFFMGFFSVYLRQCGSTSPAGPDGFPAGSLPATSRSRRSRGLDAAIISSFPTLLYSDVKHHKLGKLSLECAVCLSDFDDEDTLRLLPHCSHAFHPDCIDMWLASHSTCPVCRHNLTLPPPAAPEQSPAEPPPELQMQEHVTIVPVQPPEPQESSNGGSKRFRIPALWRSRTAPRVQYWGEEERERFTLRLPESVRREVMQGKLRRSATVAVGEGRERRRFRGEGSSRLGRSLKSTGRSDRWSFLSRPLSFKFTRGGGGGGGDAEGSWRKGMEGEGSMKGKSVVGTSSVLSPRDCFGGGALKSSTAADKEEEYTSIV